jgi:hypothetical protein
MGLFLGRLLALPFLVALLELKAVVPGVADVAAWIVLLAPVAFFGIARRRGSRRGGGRRAWLAFVGFEGFANSRQSCLRRRTVVGGFVVEFQESLLNVSKGKVVFGREVVDNVWIVRN